MPRSCESCGTPAPPTWRAHRRFCNACRDKRKRASARKWVAKTKAAESNPLLGGTMHCHTCGTPIERDHSRRRYCPPCSEATRVVTQRRAQARAQARKLAREVTCLHCHAVFRTPAKSQALLCSDECRQARSKEQQRLAKIRARAIRAKQPVPVEAARQDEPSEDWPSVVRRIASTAGPESAAKFVEHLNRRRRRSGEAEVRL